MAQEMGSLEKELSSHRATAGRVSHILRNSMSLVKDVKKVLKQPLALGTNLKATGHCHHVHPLCHEH